MHSPLVNLFGKLGLFRNGRAAANGPQDTTPAWPAPVRKPDVMARKLALASRGSSVTQPPIAPPAGGPAPVTLHRPETVR